MAKKKKIAPAEPEKSLGSLMPDTLYVVEDVLEDGAYYSASENVGEFDLAEGTYVGVYDRREIRRMVVTRELL